MLPAKTFSVVFFPRDSQKEIYYYSDRDSALEHFRLFYEGDSEGLYSSIVIKEYDWEQEFEILLGVLSFTELDASGSVIRKDWRNWSVGRHTIWEMHGSEGDLIFSGIITEIHPDHAIMKADGKTLRVDDDSLYMFR